MPKNLVRIYNDRDVPFNSRTLHVDGIINGLDFHYHQLFLTGTIPDLRERWDLYETALLTGLDIDIAELDVIRKLGQRIVTFNDLSIIDVDIQSEGVTILTKMIRSEETGVWFPSEHTEHKLEFGTLKHIQGWSLEISASNPIPVISVQFAGS